MLSITGSRDSTTRLGGAQAQFLHVALHALAIVVELSLQTAQVIEVLVTLGSDAESSSRAACAAGSATAPPQHRPAAAAPPPPPLAAAPAPSACAGSSSSLPVRQSVLCLRHLWQASRPVSRGPGGAGAAAAPRRRCLPVSSRSSWSRPSSWP